MRVEQLFKDLLDTSKGNQQHNTTKKQQKQF